MTANRKDILCGLVFILIGLVFIYQGRELDLGTATRMGPGYFPLVLCGLLILIGLIIAARAFRRPDEPFGAIPWRAMILIVSATVFFGYSVRGVGLIPAVFVVAFAAAFSSNRMKLPLALALSTGLAVFCAGVFVWGLGLPIQLFGPWVRFW